jgi:V8-like Glu-specific endopeptidase
VLKWAGARDRHDQVVRVARRANPDNAKLRDLEKKIGTGIRTEDLMELEKVLVTAPLELQHVLDVGRGFDDVLWRPLVEPEGVQTAFRRIVDRLASMPKQPDGALPLYTFAVELAALVDREAAVQDWVTSLRLGAPPRVRLAARPSSKAVRSGDLAGARALERIVKQSRAFQHIAILRRAMERAEYQVCRVLTQGGAGTGFLVARDVVLTCEHVVHGVAPAGITLEFDYKVRTPGQPAAPGPKYMVKSILETSPPSAADSLAPPKSVEATSNELDYAFLHVDGDPGDEVVDGNARGWVELAAAGHEILKGSDLVIVQHPLGGPMQIVFDEIGEVNAGKTRVTYTANTEPGSSGSPCFNADWQVVALHHSGDPRLQIPAQYNEGVPLATIRTRLEDGTRRALGWP